MRAFLYSIIITPVILIITHVPYRQLQSANLPIISHKSRINNSIILSSPGGNLHRIALTWIRHTIYRPNKYFKENNLHRVSLYHIERIESKNKLFDRRQFNSCKSRIDRYFTYRFPFQSGEQHLISAGPFGKNVHQNKYAVDFAMPAGTPVLAARDGVVINIKKDGRYGGISPYFESETNYILIRHSDNTIARYLHLMTDGVLVKPDQTVHTGDLIGYSGGTGTVTGAHLHFEVSHTDCNGRVRTIPVAFLTQNYRTVYPARGMIAIGK